MERCWLVGAAGDALHVVLCAVGYNLRWLGAPGADRFFLRFWRCLFAWRNFVSACSSVEVQQKL
jgi:IS5 family transposase